MSIAIDKLTNELTIILNETWLHDSERMQVWTNIMQSPWYREEIDDNKEEKESGMFY